MTKQAKKRLGRMENASRFRTPYDALNAVERKYIDDLYASMDAMHVQILEDLCDPTDEAELAHIAGLRAALPKGATWDAPCEAHLSERSKRKIDAVLQMRARVLQPDVDSHGSSGNSQ